jgi:hypothetical protein
MIGLSIVTLIRDRLDAYDAKVQRTQRKNTQMKSPASSGGGTTQFSFLSFDLFNENNYSPINRNDPRRVNRNPQQRNNPATRPTPGVLKPAIRTVKHTKNQATTYTTNVIKFVAFKVRGITKNNQVSERFVNHMKSIDVLGVSKMIRQLAHIKRPLRGAPQTRPRFIVPPIDTSPREARLTPPAAPSPRRLTRVNRVKRPRRTAHRAA